ncbi:10038_t:CDS:2, partial [Gigaspora margarita]
SKKERNSGSSTYHWKQVHARYSKKSAPSLRTELSSGLEEALLGPREIWFKYGVAKTRIFFKGIVDVMRREIKKELLSLLDEHIIDNIAIEELKHKIKHEVNDTIKKVIAQQKSADKIIKENFEKLIPISYPTFEWGKETNAQQMDEVREIKSANVLLTSGGDIAIGPSRTDHVWVEQL